jgi:hypothetical protein
VFQLAEVSLIMMKEMSHQILQAWALTKREWDALKRCISIPERADFNGYIPTDDNTAVS